MNIVLELLFRAAAVMLVAGFAFYLGYSWTSIAIICGLTGLIVGVVQGLSEDDD